MGRSRPTTHPLRFRVERPATPTGLIPLIYLLAIGGAEYAVAVNPPVGVPIHGAILVALIFHGSATRQPALRSLLWALTLAPVIRILSLALPLAQFPLIYWFAIISGPLFLATAAGARALGYSPRDLGLIPWLRFLPLCLVALPAGAGLGWMEYHILRSPSLAANLTVQATWSQALILTISTGFCEELIFRGLLQRAAVNWLGRAWGLLYVSLLFAALHTGYLSLTDFFFVLAVGELFALTTLWSRSIYVAALCHSALNVSFYLIWPLLLR